MKRITLAWALTLCSFITFIACSSPDVGERNVSIIPAPAQMTVGDIIKVKKKCPLHGP